MAKKKVVKPPKGKAPAPAKKKPAYRPKKPLKEVASTPGIEAPQNSKYHTADKLAVFLVHLAQTGNVRASSKRAKIDSATVYIHRRDDAVFAAAYEQAMAIAVENLEGEAFRRALDGTDKPVYQGGKKVGTIKEYSDTLLIFLLKGRKRATYGDNFKLSGDADAPLTYEDLGREGAMAEIAAILAGFGIAPPAGTLPGAAGVEVPVGGITGPANAGATKPS